MNALHLLLMTTLIPMGHPPPGPSRIAHMTAYCSVCSTGNTATGKTLAYGYVAADTHLHHGKAPAGARHVNGNRWRWWWYGDRIWFGDPINRVLTVEDTGGAIRGRDRFDYCRGVQHGEDTCGVAFGTRWVPYKVVEP